MKTATGSKLVLDWYWSQKKNKLGPNWPGTELVPEKTGAKLAGYQTGTEQVPPPLLLGRRWRGVLNNTPLTDMVVFQAGKYED